MEVKLPLMISMSNKNRSCLRNLLISVCFCLTTCDIQEFQFPCYVDVCTFPRQFCNSDKEEQRCSPCTRAICQESDDRVPKACKYICSKNNLITRTAPSSTLVHSNSISEYSSDGNEVNLTHLYLIMSYSAIASTTVLVVLIVFIACYFHRKMKKKRQTQPPVLHVGGTPTNLVEESPLLKSCVDIPTGCQQCQVSQCVPPSYYTTEEGHTTCSESSCDKSETRNLSTPTEESDPQAATCLYPTKPQKTLNENLAEIVIIDNNQTQLHELQQLPCVKTNTDIGLQTAFQNSEQCADSSHDREHTSRLQLHLTNTVKY